MVQKFNNEKHKQATKKQTTKYVTEQKV